MQVEPLLRLTDVTVGFLVTQYSVFESAGPIVFQFGVIEGELGFDVDLIFSTSDVTAISKSPIETVMH